MRWTPEDAMVFTGKVTPRSAELFAAFSLHHQEIIHAIRAENPDTPFVLIPFGSVPNGTATQKSDLDLLVVYDDSKDTSFQMPSFSQQAQRLGIKVSPCRTSIQSLKATITNPSEWKFFDRQVGYFLVSPFFGDSEDIAFMRNFRETLIIDIKLGDPRRHKEIQDTFSQYVCEYAFAEEDHIVQERKSRLAQVLQTLGISYDTWMGRRSVRFPLTLAN